MNPKSSLASLLVLNSIVAGPYKNIDMPIPKPVRNVPEYARKKDQGRNEKCNCGSGKKHKKCCGSHACSEIVQVGKETVPRD